MFMFIYKITTTQNKQAKEIYKQTFSVPIMAVVFLFISDLVAAIVGTMSSIRNTKLCYFGDNGVFMAKSPIAVLFAVVHNVFGC